MPTAVHHFAHSMRFATAPAIEFLDSTLCVQADWMAFSCAGFPPRLCARGACMIGPNAVVAKQKKQSGTPATSSVTYSVSLEFGAPYRWIRSYQFPQVARHISAFHISQLHLVSLTAISFEYTDTPLILPHCAAQRQLVDGTQVGTAQVGSVCSWSCEVNAFCALPRLHSPQRSSQGH